MNCTLPTTAQATNGRLRPSLYDLAEVVRAVKLIVEPGGVVELRLLNATVGGARWPSTYTGYFGDPAKLASALEAVTSASGCYVTLNPIDGSLLARACNRLAKAGKGGTTSDNNVTRRRWLLIDIDAQRPAGISASKEERDAALDRMRAVDMYLHNLGWPLPVTADSGNGYHLLYRVDLPPDDGGIVKRCLDALAAEYDDDQVTVDTTVHNPARIIKLYGTLACKGDSTPDRPHRMAIITDVPEPLDAVPIEMLEELGGATIAAQNTVAVPNRTGSQTFDAADFISRANLDVSEPHEIAGTKTWTVNTSPLCEHHGDGPWLTQFASGALSAGCHHNSCAWDWHDLRAKLEPKHELIFGGQPKHKKQRDDDDNEQQQPVERFTLPQLREQFPHMHVPVVDGLFRAGETVNIIAAPKMGKSWLGYGLGIAVATGSKWLTEFKTSQGRVLLVDNELHPPTIARRVPRVAEALGFRPEDYEHNFDVWTLRGRLRSLAELAVPFADMEADYYKLIILDAKYRFALAGVSENDNAAETLVYNTLDQLADQTGAAFVLIHHASKGNQSSKSVTDVGAGAGAQSQAADCHIVLREHEEPGVVVLDAAVRSFPPVEPLPLRFEFPIWVRELGVDPADLKGQKTKSEERQNDKDREGTSQIIDAMLVGPITARALRETTGISRGRLTRLLESLAAGEKLYHKTTIVEGNKYRQYHLSK